MNEFERVVRETNAKGHGDQYTGTCPVHDDGNASLSIARGKTQDVVVTCHAGCDPIKIRKRLGLTGKSNVEPEQFISTQPVTYDYRNANGDLVLQVVRLWDAAKNKKTFLQRQPNGDGWINNIRGVERPLYRMNQFANTTGPIFVVEGEKDADRLFSANLTATCNPGGAGSFKHVAEWAKSSLCGREVIIVPDNDPPGKNHAQDVLGRLTGIAESVRILELPGLPEKGDVSDWLDDHTIDEFMAIVESTRPHGFVSIASDVSDGNVDLEAKSQRVIPFGVDFLDDYFGGIMPHDVVLLGAKTGVGKTQLAVNIAQNAATEGKRVRYFALEAEPREIRYRIQYQLLSALWLERNPHDLLNAQRWSYRNWYMRRIRDLSDPLDAEVAHMMSTLGNLSAYYRGSDFTLPMLRSLIAKHRNDTDLFVLDHFHYVDKDSKQNEVEGATDLVKGIRDMALDTGVPVVVVAHLRKTNQYRPHALPTEEEFHGTSNLTKVATKIVMLRRGGETVDPTKRQTIFTIPKCRISGACPWVAAVNYDTTINGYDSGYRLGFWDEKEAFFRVGNFSRGPQWAKNINCE